jgi:hypothetical protein
MSFSDHEVISSSRRQPLTSFREPLNIVAQITLMGVALAHGFDPEAVKSICALAVQEQFTLQAQGASYGKSH